MGDKIFPMDKMQKFKANILAKAQNKVLDGQDHLVIPVVAIKAGVVNGFLYSPEELENFVAAWNGVPIPVNHPPKTANTVECEEKFNIGKFYNVVFEDNAIKGEIWLNIEKAKKLGFCEIVDHFEKGEMMEVSTGLFCEVEQTPGVHNSEQFTGIVKGIRPDHLALLPEDIGACSIADGCGAM